MSFLLILVPVFALLSGVLVYRFHGHAEIFKLDLIQFFYAFVLSPLLFVWGKSVLFLILRTEIGSSLSQGSLFLYDTVFSTLFLYIYAFVVMHSLTASFNLKMFSNPKYDLFLDSEYLHLWLTHIVIFLGGLALVSLLGMINVIFELPLSLSRSAFYSLNATAFLVGVLLFLAMIPLSDPKLRGRNFRRLMKASFGMFFIGQISAYFFLPIPFNSTRLAFWMSSFLFTALVLCSAVVRISIVQRWVDGFANQYKRTGWNFRKQIFSKHST